MESILNKIQELLIEKGIEEVERKSFIQQIQTELKGKKYGLVWENKVEKVSEKLKTQIPYLTEMKEKRLIGSPEDEIHHLLIEGDNLEALTLLQATHKGEIDICYIDPPYNTLEEGFTYNDKLVDATDQYRDSKWLSFMEKRIRIASELLCESGVLLVSIDDNEMYQLKLLCDEIFGPDNFLLNIVVNRPSEIAKATTVSKHEYILVYSKDKKVFENKKSAHSRFVISRGTVGNLDQSMPEIKFPTGLNCYNIPDGVYRKTRQIPGSKENIENLTDIIVENGKLKNDIVLKARWRSSNDMRNFFKNNCQPTKAKISGEIVEIYFENDKFNPQIKKATPNKLSSLYLNNKKGSTELSNMGLDFSYPKSKDLIKDILKQLNLDKDATILDFFAGSGTTGHAIIELNQEDEGKRQFILCTNNEVSSKKQCEYFGLTKKELLKFSSTIEYKNRILEEDFQSLGICQAITYERLKRAIKGYVSTKGMVVDKIPANLHYYKINTIPKVNNSTDNAIEYLTKGIEIIGIKENAFNREDFKEYSILSNKDKVILVYLEPFVLGHEVIEISKKLKRYEQSQKIIYSTMTDVVVHGVEVKEYPQEILEQINRIQEILKQWEDEAGE